MLILLLLALPWLKPVAYSSGGCTDMVCSLREAGHGHGHVCPMKMNKGAHALGHKDAANHSLASSEMTDSGTAGMDKGHEAGHGTFLSCNCDGGHDSPLAAPATYLIKDLSFRITFCQAGPLVTAARMYEGPGASLPERPPSV